jgi:Transposase DDE domain
MFEKMTCYPSFSQTKEPTMDNDKKLSVVCQCLRVLDLQNYRSIFDDHRSKKLFAGSAIGLHVVAQLLQLQSYSELAEQLHAHTQLAEILGLSSISASQLARKTRSLCTSSLLSLFTQLTSKLQKQTKQLKGISPNIGRLHVIDATSISLPLIMGEWAKCSNKKCGVILHTRVMVASPSVVYPNRVIATTAHVHESAVVMELIQTDDTTYVMDRGYSKFKNFEIWLTTGVRFVIRLRDWDHMYPIEGTDKDIPSDTPHIIRDVDVLTAKTKTPMRMVEYVDEQGRHYRVGTSRWDLTAAEVAEIYKNRWLVELFFKWIKQHLHVVKLYSTEPAAVWNQLFLSLIAYAVHMLIMQELQTTKSPWETLKLLRIYFFDHWARFVDALFRPPSRRSKGRQKTDNAKVRLSPSRIIVK